MLQKSVIHIILIAFCWTSIGPLPDSYAQTLIDLPAPGVMVNKSLAYQPLQLKGILVNAKNPLRFDFLVDKGNSGLSGELLKKDITRLAKYFLTCLAVPEDDLWVNLSPYEKDRIVPGNFGVTLMGKDLLEQDYLLKQIMASLSYPENDLGKRFWQKVYLKSRELYGRTDIPINTFNKVWILPKRAEVYVQGNSAFVVSSQLDVMLEADYFSMSKHADVGVAEGGASPARAGYEHAGETRGQDPNINVLGSQVVREIIIPELAKEVNGGKNFAVVRQVYNAMILATWYKRHLKDSLLARDYVGKNQVSGVDIADKNAKEKIFQQYIKAYKKGVYNYIKEEAIPPLDGEGKGGVMIPHKYFSGGMDFKDFGMSSRYYREVNSTQGMEIGSDLAMATVDMVIKGPDAAMVSKKTGNLVRRFLLGAIVMAAVCGAASSAQAAGLRHILHLGDQITAADHQDNEKLEENISPEDVDALIGNRNPLTKKVYDFDTAPYHDPEHWHNIFQQNRYDDELRTVHVAFQHKHHLREDGSKGPVTRKALYQKSQEPEDRPSGLLSMRGLTPASITLSEFPASAFSASSEETPPDTSSDIAQPAPKEKIASLARIIPPTMPPSPSAQQGHPWTLNYNFPQVGMIQGKTPDLYFNSQGSVIRNVSLSDKTTLTLGGLFEVAKGDWVNGGPAPWSLANFGGTGGITHDWGPVEGTVGFTPGSVFVRAKAKFAQLSLLKDKITLGPPEGFVYVAPQINGGSVVEQLNLPASYQINPSWKLSGTLTLWHVPANETFPDQYLPWVNVNLAYQSPTVPAKNAALVLWHIPGINDFERATSNFLAINSPLAYSESIGLSHTFTVKGQNITWGPSIAWNLWFQGTPYGLFSVALSGTATSPASAGGDGGSPPPPPQPSAVPVPVNVASAVPPVGATPIASAATASAVSHNPPQAGWSMPKDTLHLNSLDSLTQGESAFPKKNIIASVKGTRHHRRLLKATGVRQASVQIPLTPLPDAIELAALQSIPSGFSGMSAGGPPPPEGTMSEQLQPWSPVYSASIQGAEGAPWLWWVGFGILGISVGGLWVNRRQRLKNNSMDSAQVSNVDKGGIDMNSRLMQLNIEGHSPLEQQGTVLFNLVIKEISPQVARVVTITPHMLRIILGQG